jgi:hypothetical protein
LLDILTEFHLAKKCDKGAEPQRSSEDKLTMTLIEKFIRCLLCCIFVLVFISCTNLLIGGRIDLEERYVMDHSHESDLGQAKSGLDLQIQPVDEFLDSIGVCVHFSGRCEKPIRLMREAGIRHLRDEISWDWVEREKGRLKIPEEREAWIDEARKQGINILLILNYGNAIYPDDGIGNKENPEYEFTDFLRYVEFVVSHFKGRIHQWEIWNEPNAFLMNRQYGGDWRGGGWVDAYARLANKAARKIRALDPAAKIYTAGMEAPIADLVVPHLEAEFDGIAVHPYCHPLLPEYTYAGIERLRNTMKRCGKDLPLIVTEQGYPTIKGHFMWRHAANITLEDQAKFLLRVFCGNFARNIPRTYWYDLICDGSDPSEQEHNFGILHADGETPRPAYLALKALTSALSEQGDSEPAPADAVAGNEVHLTFYSPVSAPPRGILLARNSTHYFLLLWKESPAKDELEINGTNTDARVFHDDGAPEPVTIGIPSFSAGRLEATVIDPLLGGDKGQWLTVYSDGLTNKITVPIKEYPIIIRMVFK